MAFLPYPVIDLYIRAFVSGSQPHSGHRYFIDLRPNTPGHLWLGFALSPKGTVAGADSRLQRAVSVVGNTSRFFQRSIKGSVSGRYPVIPLLGISVRKAVAFPSLLPLCRKILRKVYMRQRVAALSNGASLCLTMCMPGFPVLQSSPSPCAWYTRLHMLLRFRLWESVVLQHGRMQSNLLWRERQHFR